MLKTPKQQERSMAEKKLFQLAEELQSYAREIRIDPATATKEEIENNQKQFADKYLFYVNAWKSYCRRKWKYVKPNPLAFEGYIMESIKKANAA